MTTRTFRGLLASALVIFPLGLHAQSPEPPAKRSLVIGPDQADFYPIAFHNVNGLSSSIILTTLSSVGNYLICVRNSTNFASTCSPFSFPAGQVTLDVSGLGLQNSTGIIQIQPTDSTTFGASIQLVQNASGSVSFIEPFLAQPPVSFQ